MQHDVVTMAHLGARAFDSIPGEIVQVSAFVIESGAAHLREGLFFRLVSGRSEAEKMRLLLRAISDTQDELRFQAGQSDFRAISSAPLAYWLAPRVREVFRTSRPLRDFAHPTGGMTTGDNERFLRRWTELSLNTLG